MSVTPFCRGGVCNWLTGCCSPTLVSLHWSLRGHPVPEGEEIATKWKLQHWFFFFFFFSWQSCRLGAHTEFSLSRICSSALIHADVPSDSFGYVRCGTLPTTPFPHGLQKRKKICSVVPKISFCCWFYVQKKGISFLLMFCPMLFWIVRKFNFAWTIDISLIKV